MGRITIHSNVTKVRKQHSAKQIFHNILKEDKITYPTGAYGRLIEVAQEVSV